MRILITGVCGFVGSALASELLQRVDGLSIVGVDNLMRPGSETNVTRLRRLGVKVIHGDLRLLSDTEALPACHWVVEAAANPSVLAGLSGAIESRRLLEHNLVAVGNILEYCKRVKAGLLLLSSSRVYSIPALLAIPLKKIKDGYVLDDCAALPTGVTPNGINEDFSTAPPVSLYGCTKLAAEALSLEYGLAFGFPVWVTRCGVLTGAGQFGTPEQGIFAYWVNAHLRRRPLRYIGFNGTGAQTRDMLHPRDLAALLVSQMRNSREKGQRVYTVGGGVRNAISLAQLTAWCDERFGRYSPERDTSERPYDIPWIAMDSASAERDFGFAAETGLPDILNEIAVHAEAHPDWLELSNAYPRE